MVLPAAYRMRRHAEFAATIRAGRRAGRGSLVAHFAVHAPVPTEPTQARDQVVPVRVGFVVPKAVGTAVARNRVRRRLRHLMRHRLGALPPGSALVLRVLPGAAGADGPSLARHLDEVLAAVVTGRGRRARAGER